MSSSLSVLDFDYELPPSLIAQTPAPERTQSRLLVVSPDRNTFKDRVFKEILNYLQPNDLLVFNNTRVIKARLFGHKATGGQVEVLVERVFAADRALAHVRASKAPKPGQRIYFSNQVWAEVQGREDALFLLRFNAKVMEVLQQWGHVPLPPYIEHADGEEDEERYQTVYAREDGAVAAPTAGLHFDEDLLEALSQQGVNFAFVTLHVGAGTFQPVRVQRIEDHVMHAEWYCVPEETAQAIVRCRQAGGRVFAVGTTAVRSLESAAKDAGLLQPRCPQAHCADTRLFVTPGFQFQVIDGLLTNFHLPQSTLLMLVAALMGLEPMKKTYQHAIDQRYRFFSYGDAMLILPQEEK